MTSRWFGVTVAIVVSLGSFPTAARAQGCGGGVDRWMSDHGGFRLEVRDQVWLTSSGVGSGLLGLRIGLVFR
jgi:hypothetical protein